MMTSAVETDTTFAVRQNAAILWVLAALMAACAVCFAFAAWIMISVRTSFDWLDALFVCTALAFGWLAAIACRRALNGDRVVVTLSPDGYRDVNVGPVTVPWSGVRRIWLLRHKGVWLRLELTAEMAALVERPGAIGRLQRVNRLSLHPTVTTNLNLLRIDPKRLLEVVQAYAAAHGASQHRI